MLVLSRRVDESIVINGNIVVTVVDIRGDKVRLGINAPKEVPVDREEVFQSKKANGELQNATQKCVSDAVLPRPPQGDDC